MHFFVKKEKKPQNKVDYFSILLWEGLHIVDLLW
jgi:hypothetical protein